MLQDQTPPDPSVVPLSLTPIEITIESKISFNGSFHNYRKPISVPL